MKIERLRVGLEVLNKVDGKEYKVTKVDGTIGTAVEMSKDPATGMIGFGNGEVTITEKNALAFRILRDPEPYPVPEGYSVRDGILIKDGKPACAQGEFFFIKLLNVWPDCILLAARTKGMADGDIVLVSYRVSCDRFKKMRVVPENIVFLGCAGENMREAVFLFSNTEEKEIGTDGEKKTARCFKETALVIVAEGTACIYKKINIPVTVKDCFIEKIPGSRDGAYEVFLASDEEENDGVLVSRKERTWMRFQNWNMDCSITFSYGGSIRADWSPAYEDFVIRGKDMLRVKDFVAVNPAVAKLEGYDILIDITEEDYTYKLTFSNGDYGLKTLLSRSTRDRGYVVTVE